MHIVTILMNHEVFNDAHSLHAENMNIILIRIKTDKPTLSISWRNSCFVTKKKVAQVRRQQISLKSKRYHVPERAAEK